MREWWKGNRFEGLNFILKKKNFKSTWGIVRLTAFLKKLFIFGCAGSLCYMDFSLIAVSRGYSLVVAHRLLLLWSTGSRACRLQQLQFPGSGHRLNSCGARAWLLLSMWDLLRSGITPVFPALAGRFFTTEPPGKSYPVIFKWRMHSCITHIIEINFLKYMITCSQSPHT